jgi:Leucine-rich repeat (LRR) protein
MHITTYITKPNAKTIILIICYACVDKANCALCVCVCVRVCACVCVCVCVSIGRKSSSITATVRNTRATTMDTLKSRVASFLFIDTDTPPSGQGSGTWSRLDGHGATAERTVQINDVSQFDDITVWTQLRNNATRLVVNDEDSKLTSLPRALFDITTLTSLCLVSTSLKELPPELAKLKIVSLQLTDNGHLRSISAGVKAMATLRELELRNNPSCRLPRSLQRLTQLTSVQVHACKAKSGLPDGLLHLKQLEHLAYTQCALSKLPRSLATMTSLLHLDLSQNQLKVLPDALSSLTGLQELRVSHNQLHRLPSGLGRLTQLRRLYLAGNKFTNVPEVVGQLPSLIYLNIRKNSISSFTLLPSGLRVLLLDDNRLEGLPEAVCRCMYLDTLSLDNNLLSSIDDAVLASLKSLKSLSLSGNKGLKCVPLALTLMPALRRVELRGTGIKRLPTSLAANLNHLSVINLDDDKPESQQQQQQQEQQQQGGLSAVVEQCESVVSSDTHHVQEEEEEEEVHM